MNLAGYYCGMFDIDIVILILQVARAWKWELPISPAWFVDFSIHKGCSCFFVYLKCMAWVQSSMDDALHENVPRGLNTRGWKCTERLEHKRIILQEQKQMNNLPRKLSAPLQSQGCITWHYSGWNVLAHALCKGEWIFSMESFVVKSSALECESRMIHNGFRWREFVFEWSRSR